LIFSLEERSRPRRSVPLAGEGGYSIALQQTELRRSTLKLDYGYL